MIGADAVTALPVLRQMVESLMLDMGRLERRGGPPVLDEDTGEYVTPPPLVVYQGKGRVRAPSDAAAMQLGEQRVSFGSVLIDVPYTVTDVQPGDRWRVVTSPDPRLTGRVLTVTGVRSETLPLRRVLAATDDQG